MELNREQTEKSIDYLKRVLCNWGNWKTHHTRLVKAIEDVFALLLYNEQKLFELENRLKECENGYEGTLYLERCKLHDAEERFKKLTDACAKEVDGWKKHFESLFETAKETVRADTVREMQGIIQGIIEFDIALTEDETTYLLKRLDETAQEMLEGEK